MSEALLNPVGHMRRALRLAEKGLGLVLPNPMVGAILVKDGQRISEGFHERFGGDHAEIVAIKNCSESIEGSTLYVTLEPCCHQGKTAPCTDAIIKAGIKKVVIASIDPSEKVNGKGAQQLRDAGIEVEIGLLKEPAEELNEQFYTFHKMKRPFISLKAALSIDGKISISNSERTFLTGVRAKKTTDILRSHHHGILVGSGTVISDNPNLGLTMIEGKEPLRIILGKNSKLNKSSKIFRDDNYLIIEEENLDEVMKKCFEMNILSILVEGGHEIFSSFIKKNLVDRYYFYYAPVILGEKTLDLAKIESPVSLKFETVQKLGTDIFISAVPNEHN